MPYRLSQLIIVIIGYSIIHLTGLVFPLNTTNPNKMLCYSCKGIHCETILNEEDNLILCNKHTQLCWAGFVDQLPCRTCASRYCTPNGISLDSDIRTETCCHASLCNSVSLSWLVWSKWYKKPSTHPPGTSTVETTKVNAKQTTTIANTKRHSTTPEIYIVNEIVDNPRYPSIFREETKDQDDSVLSSIQLNASDPASYGIVWHRIPSQRSLSNRDVTINKLLILLMFVLLC